MVKVRLQREGKKKAPFYHIVVADSKSPRDGKIIEQIGTYDPMTKPSTIVLDKEKYEQWIKNGAQPTDTVKALVKNDFDGFVRPDHGRNIFGEDKKPGYGLYDRALGCAYINGLFEAYEDKENK